MGKKQLEEANLLNTLLNTYSVKEITGLFTQIDNSLLSLHKCSADDFLRLSASFKEIFNQAKQISTNVKNIISKFDADQNQHLINEIEKLHLNLKLQCETFERKIAFTNDQFEKLFNQIRHIFFPIKNYSQNLMSLNYLIANLKVTLSYNNTDNDLGQHYEKTENIIYKIKLLTDEISNSLNLLSKTAKKVQTNLNLLKRTEDKSFEELLPEIKSTIDTIINKDKENRNIVPELTEELKESESSVSEIIKKLQYQDIIRQKMEHIQQTHKDLIAELIQFNSPNLNTEKLTEKVKCFIRIRDISGLQAAQLIHANKEYQAAIEVIINNFIQIGDNTKSVIEKSKKVYNYGNVDYTLMYENIGSFISKALIHIKNLVNKNKILNEEIEKVHNMFSQIEKLISNFNQEILSLENLLNSQKDILKTQSDDKNSFENAKEQFSHLFNETRATNEKLNRLFESLFELKYNIDKFKESKDHEIIPDSDFSEMKQMLNLFRLSGKEMDQMIDENNYLSRSMLLNIKKSISKIEYYDFFENIMQGIISELNTINFKLKTSDHVEGISIEENLEKLKQYYTMQTEHFIHDKIAKGEDHDINLNIEEDDEIEFF